MSRSVVSFLFVFGKCNEPRLSDTILHAAAHPRKPCIKLIHKILIVFRDMLDLFHVRVHPPPLSRFSASFDLLRGVPVYAVKAFTSEPSRFGRRASFQRVLPISASTDGSGAAFGSCCSGLTETSLSRRQRRQSPMCLHSQTANSWKTRSKAYR